MKLIIDIPEWKYKSICEGIEASKRCGVVGIDPDIHEAIYNGTPYDERPQGEWITRHKLNSFGQDVVCFECNKCGEYKVPLYHLLITEPLKVCPNCGADMRKDGRGPLHKRGVPYEIHTI